MSVILKFRIRISITNICEDMCTIALVFMAALTSKYAPLPCFPVYRPGVRRGAILNLHCDSAIWAANEHQVLCTRFL